MVAKTVIDKTKLLNLFKKGLSAHEIATKHLDEICLDHKVKKVSEQILGRYKRAFIEKRLLKNTRREAPTPKNHEPLKVLSENQLDEIAMTMYERALQYPTLKEQINRLENQLASAHNSIKILEGKEKERVTKSQRFKLAKQQGDIGGEK